MEAKGYLVDPVPAPDLHIPKSSNTVTVRMIDSTTRLQVPMGGLLENLLYGNDTLAGPAFSFLVEHPSTSRKLLFDLGTRKDWENLAPKIYERIKQPGWNVKVDKSVSEILTENNVELKSIEAIVWSHWHWDHLGDPSLFPGSTALVVGPGFKEAFMPAYPKNKDSPLNETDFEGREVREVNFEKDEGTGIKIGYFNALDYFGDGSFYLLDTPGHAIGHLCALARVTADTFVFMGGDACHHGAEFRPTEYLPLPKDVQPSPIKGYKGGVCPGQLLQDLHYDKSATKPFYTVRPDFAYNLKDADWTIRGVEEFDATDNVLVVIAHDPHIFEKDMPFFPDKLNGWKEHELNKKVRWKFLQDFQPAVDQHMKNEKA